MNKQKPAQKMNRLRIRRGDRVIVISGKDKGKVAKVLRVLPKERRLILEGVNFIHRHSRSTQTNVQSGIIEREAPVHVSNVMYYDETSKKGTRIGVKVLEDGRRVRMSRKTQEIIDR